MSIIRCAIVIILWLSGLPALAAPESSPQSLDQLLERVKQRQSQEKAVYREREQRFLQNRDRRQQMLEEAKARFMALQKKNNPLQKKADANAERIKAMREELDQHITDLGDIYSIYNEFAGDFIARMQDSLVQTQLSDRQQQFAKMQSRETLPKIDEMRELWLLLQQEMTEAGKISRYPAAIIQADGSPAEREVIRIGTFSAVSDGEMLRYVPENRELIALARQPDSVKATLAQLAKPQGETVAVVIDPTRGSLLSMLGQSPDLQERISQGREVGYAIIALGAAGLLLALYRVAYLGVVWLKTRKQLGDIGKPLNNNPLGRVLQQASVLANSDEQTLQSKLDESILKEVPALEQGQGLIKLLAAIAPLLGLLGTVIGMIATFQSISLFGTGDPKLMASGISQALVTTVLGLVVAIPLLFSHNIVSAFSRSLVQILDEQSAGILARHLEKQHGIGNGAADD